MIEFNEKWVLFRLPDNERGFKVVMFQKEDVE